MMLDVLKKKQIEYLKSKDQLRLGVLRYLISEIQNKEIDMRAQGMELKDKHILKVIEKQIKQRKDSIESYKQGNRDDLVQKETAELGVLEELLELFPKEE